MEIVLIIVGAVFGLALLLFLLMLPGLIYRSSPNEVMIFSGPRRRVGDRIYNYILIKGGWRIRIPVWERVDRMDLTNMTIDIAAQNAYSKGGIPLTVQGVANVKIAGHEPLLNNAIERFLGRSRTEVAQVAKATLEGSLRGVLATMTPEQVNEDKILFAERLVAEVEQDMTALGLVVDTLKVQSVQDDVKYLDSIGRARNAEIVSHARVAEAIARADSVVRSAENEQKETEAQINAQIQIAKADAQKRLTDALTRRAALVAEEQAQVIAAVAQSKAELEVQKARVEQIRGKLDAEVIQPALAAAEASEAQARASTVAIVEEGKARAESLRSLAATWEQAGPNARTVLMAQKLESVIQAIVGVIPETEVEKVTMIGSGDGSKFPLNAVSALEQIKQVFGVDVVEKLKALGGSNGQPAPQQQAPALQQHTPVPDESQPVRTRVVQPGKPTNDPPPQFRP